MILRFHLFPDERGSGYSYLAMETPTETMRDEGLWVWRCSATSVRSDTSPRENSFGVYRRK